MAHLRCLIADIPQLVLADIVQRVAEENEDVEVVDRVTGIDNLSEVVRKQAIDVLILGMKNNMLPQVCNDVMDTISDLLVVGLVDDGRRAAIYVDDVGGNEIVKIIRILGGRSAIKSY